MMAPLIFVLLSCLSLLPEQVLSLTGIAGNQLYEPACAYGCYSALSTFSLSCSEMESMDGSDGMSMMMEMMATTSPDCRANDTAWLGSMAWCMHTKCAEFNVPTWRLEKWWAVEVTGDPSVAAKWSYGAALAQVGDAPTRNLTDGDVLDTTSLVPEAEWWRQWLTNASFRHLEYIGSVYSIAICIVGVATPLLFSLLGYLPYMTGIFDRLKPYLIYPSLIGTYNIRPFPFSLGSGPTIGQALFVGLMTILNIILTAVNFRSYQPASFFATRYQEIVAYIMYRTGYLSFGMFPLLILFAGRNNFLLWVTNWSHSTFVLLHRWVARLFAIQVILHSIVGLVLHQNMGDLAVQQKSPYWIWGAVGTVAVSIMVVISGLYFRRKNYELFLISHVLLAVFVIAGTWYHIDIHFERKYGYEAWIYAACAVWFFDRLVRVLRVLKNGARRAMVTDVGGGYVRVDVKGIRWSYAPGQHCYAYFPTAKPLRPWENHPFSVMPTAMLSPPTSSEGYALKHTTSGSASSDVEKHSNSSAHQVASGAFGFAGNRSGLTFFIRKNAGLTRSLAQNDRLLTLLDGPYPTHNTKDILACDRILLIGGGIGITGLLPWTTISGLHQNRVKLCWSVKKTSEVLVDSLSPSIRTRLAPSDVVVRVGSRLDVGELLEEEVRAGWEKVGVVVCGPGGLCDDVRAAVVEVGRRSKGTVFELEVDAYSW